jgi:hypothetical protein
MRRGVPCEAPPAAATGFLLGRGLRASGGEKKRQPRAAFGQPGVGRFWQRPTLAPPDAALPSGLRRFTAVFGMGTGGAAALGSPEGWPPAKPARCAPGARAGLLPLLGQKAWRPLFPGGPAGGFSENCT